MRKTEIIKIDPVNLKRYAPDNFAMQNSIKLADTSYEYEIDGRWSADKPDKRPEGTRVVFSSIDEFRFARDTYFAWTQVDSLRSKETKGNSLERPEKPYEAYQRLFTARKAQAPLTLFVPWGVRLCGQFGESEKNAMNQIVSLQQTLQNRSIPTTILIMPADLYATEVNNQVNAEAANQYFEEVKEEGLARKFLVVPWSKIRQENQGYYTQRLSELDESGLLRVLSRRKISEAIKTAGRRSGYTQPDDITRAALAYLRERICEAEIIENLYKPVKVSMVEKNKDNEVDRELPRLYIIPPYLQFPWLK